MTQLDDLRAQWPGCGWTIGRHGEQWEVSRWAAQKPYLVRSRGLTEAQALDRALCAARVDLPVARGGLA